MTTKENGSDRPSRKVYQPHSPKCTTHSCNDEIERFIQWPDSHFVAAFCDGCADIELLADGFVEVTERVA